MNMCFRTLLIAVLLACFGRIEKVRVADESMVKVKLRDIVFDIPERYSMSGSRPFWLRWIFGLEEGSTEIAITVPTDELRRSIPGYRQDVEMFGTLAVLTDEEVERYRDPGRFGDIWYGKGSYRGRRVEPLGETGWYRVYHPLEKNSWTVLREIPDPNNPLPNDPLSFFVARCSRSASRKWTDCLTYAFFDRIVIDFHADENNLALIDNIRAFLETKVLEWRREG